MRNEVKEFMYWKKTGGRKPLGRYDSFQDAFLNRPHGEDGLNTGQVDLVCIDERIKPKRDTVRMAGAGILLDKKQLEQIRLQLTPIRKVSYHPDCAEAGRFAKSHGDMRPVDEVAKEGSEKVARALFTRVSSHPVELKKPKGLHIARAVYYDATRTGYEASRISTLPTGFGISRGVFGRDIGQLDASLAMSIALGDQGFGGRFTERRPLHLVGIYDSRDKHADPEQLREELTVIKSDRSAVQISTIDIALRKPRKMFFDLKRK